MQVTEAHLAKFFQKCGKVKDCRVCGDPNSAMRFAFIEFEKEDAAGKVSEISTLPCMQACLYSVLSFLKLW